MNNISTRLNVSSFLLELFMINSVGYTYNNPCESPHSIKPILFLLHKTKLLCSSQFYFAQSRKIFLEFSIWGWLTDDGYVACWGWNDWGQLDKKNDVDISDNPKEMDNNSTAIDLASNVTTQIYLLKRIMHVRNE